jgi:LytS/YehU family sensor histidine kinase
MIACALIVFESALDSERRARREALRAVELSQALTSAELAALRMQIQPHFLFNALNSISALMSSDAARADAMLVRFSELLRATLLSSRKATTTLAEELRFSARYLDLERLRFGDRLAVVFDLPAELAGLEVPNLLLQPLVENAVKHGVQRRVGPVRLALSVRRLGDDVEVELCNDRETEKDGIGAAGLGVGLENVRRRLALAFGSGAALELDLSDPRVARTRVRFPARAGAVEAGGGAGLVTVPRGGSK